MSAMMRPTSTALLIALCIATGAHGEERDISIADETGTTCIVVTPGMPSTFFVTATFENMLPPGLEFRISGLPAGWLVSATTSSVVDFSLGDVFGNGVHMTLSCELKASSAVLFQVTVLPLDSEPALLSLMPHLFPANNVACPKFVFGVCEAPVDGFLCLPDGPRAVLGVQDDCVVATTSRTWSGVKWLYQ